MTYCASKRTTDFRRLSIKIGQEIFLLKAKGVGEKYSSLMIFILISQIN